MAKNVNKSSAASKDKTAKAWILVITLILTVVFIAIGASSLSSSAYHPISGSLVVGSQYITVYGDEYAYFAFTPYYSGYYTFTSGENSYSDPYGVLYDSNWYMLASNDDGAGERNFSLGYYLDADNTYYLGVRISNAYNSYESNPLYVYIERSYN